MIYFSLKELYIAAFSFFVLGTLLSLCNLLFVFFINLLHIGRGAFKRLVRVSPCKYKAVLKASARNISFTQGNLFDFLFTFFVGASFIFFSYLLLDGALRLFFLFIMLFSLSLSRRILFKNADKLFALCLRISNMFIYAFALVLFIFSRIFRVICSSVFYTARPLLRLFVFIFVKIKNKRHLAKK